MKKTDPLSYCAAETLRDLFNLHVELTSGDTDPKRFNESFVIPTRDTGNPAPEEVLSEYHRGMMGDLSDHDEYALVIRIGSALAGEAIRLTRLSDRDGAWEHLARAQYWVGTLAGVFEQRQRSPDTSNGARKAAMARHAKDPKRRDRRFVKECWDLWQKRPGDYKTKADFARDMLDKTIHLKSEKVITDWCREWEAEIRTLRAD